LVADRPVQLEFVSVTLYQPSKPVDSELLVSDNVAQEFPLSSLLSQMKLDPVIPETLVEVAVIVALPPEQIVSKRDVVPVIVRLGAPDNETF
jgi:hypothetical protein